MFTDIPPFQDPNGSLWKGRGHSDLDCKSGILSRSKPCLIFRRDFPEEIHSKEGL